MNPCNLFLKGFILTKKKITSIGIIIALEIKPGKKTGWFKRIIELNPIIK
jgi:hypothetical protein